MPRLAGTARQDEVRRAVAGQLAEWGYEVFEQPFTATARRLSAVSLAGAGLGWVALAVAPLMIIPLPGWPVTVAGFAALALIAVLAAGVAGGMLPSKTISVNAANLVARRGDPRLWLVAHGDSKAQRFSLATRVIAAALASVSVAALAGLLVVRLFFPLPWWIAVAVVGLATGSGAVLSLGRPLNDSPGAVDNASGVIAALVAAERLKGRRDVAVLISDAEELGMEGARVWAGSGSWTGVFINFDSLDDRGSFRVVPHWTDPPNREAANAVAASLCAGFRDCSARAVEGRLPPGVLVDGSVLASAGLAGATLCRGDWGTLQVIHTGADSAARVTLESAVLAGQVAAAVAERHLG